MRGIQRTIIATLLTCGFSAAIAPGPSSGLTTIRGRIVAYRTFDRFVQAPSFIPNREVFLVLIDKRNQTPDPTVVKINYVHFEVSDITYEILQSAGSLKMKVRRDSTCDESYAHFASTAPEIQMLYSITDAEKLSDASPGRKTIEPIRFTPGFNGNSLSPDLNLQCYDLAKGDFKVAH